MKRQFRSFRSGFEKKIEAQLKEAKVEYKYEPLSIVWLRAVSKGICNRCSAEDVNQRCSYTPDFVLANGIWIEAKGYLDGPDRTKLKAIRRQYPDLDLRLVFQRPGNIVKGTKNKTTYWQWAEANGFIWYDSKSLKGWLDAGMPVGVGARKTKTTLRPTTKKTKIDIETTQSAKKKSREQHIPFSGVEQDEDE